MRGSLLALDIYHLHVLNELFAVRSVTKVAEREGLTQPAISRILKRLRDELGDKLLVKSGAGMSLTERGHEVKDLVREILTKVTRLGADSHFQFESADRTFSIGCSDCIAPALHAGLIARVGSAAPKVRLQIVNIERSFDAYAALESGALDLVISNHPRPREDLRTSALYVDPVVCLVRRDHKFAGDQRIGLARYLTARHLAPNPNVNGEAGPIVGPMVRAGYRRNIVATVPEYSLVPHVLKGSDLVFTTGRRFAQEMSLIDGLAIVGAPSEFDDLRFHQLWHPRAHGSAANQWLREQVRAAADALPPLTNER